MRSNNGKKNCHRHRTVLDADSVCGMYQGFGIIVADFPDPSTLDLAKLYSAEFCHGKES